MWKHERLREIALIYKGMRREERAKQEADKIGIPLYVVNPQYVEGEQEAILLNTDDQFELIEKTTT
jgi:hypothetical protein